VTDTATRGLEPMISAGQTGLRGLVVVLGVAGTAVVAGLAIWLGSASSDDPTQGVPLDEPSLTADSEGEGEDTVEAEAVDEPIPLPLVTYELFLARDPFEPVVPEPAPDPTAPTDPAAPAPDDGNGPTDPSDPNSNSNSDANGACTGTVEVVCNGRVLTVIEIVEENGELVVVIQVDTMRYRVGVGDVFADNFQVISISPDQVRILFGDRVSLIEVGDNALK
jgi:hypothetical protein